MSNLFIECFRHPEILKECNVNVNGYPGIAVPGGWSYINNGVGNPLTISNALKAISNR